MPSPKTNPRLIDIVALAASGGTILGFFVTFLTFAPMPTESEWRGLIGSYWISMQEQAPAGLPADTIGFDASEASSR